MADTGMESKLNDLEAVIRDRLRTSYQEKWQSALQEMAGPAGHIPADQFPDIIEHFINEFTDFSALVALDTLGKRYLKYGMIEEALDKISSIVEHAAEMTLSGVYDFANADDDDDMDAVETDHSK